MTDKQEHKPKGLKIQDVIFILMRHKWKVLLCGASGLILAAVFYLLDRPGYQATAKLLVRYVTENRFEPEGDERNVMSTAGRADSILDSEVHILTSMDTVAEVARIIGPERILSDETQKTNLPAAIKVVAAGMEVEIPRFQTRIMVVKFRHSDPKTAHDVLGEVIDSYLERHFQMHRDLGAYEFLSRQTDQLRSRLVQTEEDLKRLKAKSNIVSLEDSKRAVNLRLEESKKALDEANAELAARQERVRQWEQIFEAGVVGSSTNAPVKMDPGLMTEYRSILDLQSELKEKQQRLSSIYTESNALVRLARDQIVEQAVRRQKFEADHPEVMASAFVVSGSQSDSALDPAAERTEVAVLKARIGQLEAQHQEARKEAEAIASVEMEITELQRRKELDETNYRYFAANLEKARIDEALDPSKMPNISKVQEPTVSRGARPELKKVCMMLALSGFALGIGLAFFIELVLDQTFKRPEEVESHASLPLLLSIPLLQLLKENPLPAKRSKWRKGTGEPALPSPAQAQEDEAAGSAVALPDATLSLYCEALRDRMMLYFQLKKMVHKPKLVAVTSCSAGAGGSTLATGLAACLSETGGGKVLLVDMNLGKGAVHPFYKGGAVPALPQTFSDEQHEEQMINENLYLSSAGDARTRQALMLPKRFGDLIPRMRASDYDYIIFDMPPVSQTAATLTLSSFMDQVLMVVEAEKSPKESVRKAVSLLQQSGTSVFGVFNKSTVSGNGWLQPKL